MYKGSCERWYEDVRKLGWSAYRLLVMHCYQDLARSVDYLQVCSDIDPKKLAFYCVSSSAWGSLVLHWRTASKAQCWHCAAYPSKGDCDPSSI